MERMRWQLWVNPREWREMEVRHESSPETHRRNSSSERMSIPWQAEDGRVRTNAPPERVVSEKKTLGLTPTSRPSPPTPRALYSFYLPVQEVVSSTESSVICTFFFFSRLWKQILKVQHPKKFLLIEKLDRDSFSSLIWMFESPRCWNRRGFVSPERWSTADSPYRLFLGQTF